VPLRWAVLIRSLGGQQRDKIGVGLRCEASSFRTCPAANPWQGVRYQSDAGAAGSIPPAGTAEQTEHRPATVHLRKSMAAGRPACWPMRLTPAMGGAACLCWRIPFHPPGQKNRCSCARTPERLQTSTLILQGNRGHVSVAARSGDLQPLAGRCSCAGSPALPQLQAHPPAPGSAKARTPPPPPHPPPPPRVPPPRARRWR